MKGLEQVIDNIRSGFHDVLSPGTGRVVWRSEIGCKESIQTWQVLRGKEVKLVLKIH